MKITDIINNAKQILIVGHMRPDGDCLGAGLSILRAADKLGKPADFVCDSNFPAQYSFLNGYDRLGKTNFPLYDTVICVDTGDIQRLGRYSEYFNKAKHTVVIDHHITNTGFGAENVILPDASSTCEILAEMLESEGLIDAVIAEYLYVGLSTDTGHFSHDNCTPKVFRLAARLMDYGADAYRAVVNLYRSGSVEKLRLLSKAIDSMRFFLDSRVCIISLKSTDIEDCGCTLDDTEGLINYAINLAPVRLAACLSQSGANSYKVSFRSKTEDVAAVAMRFGGGGHKRAAGCMVFGKYEDVIDKVRRALCDELEQ